MVLVIYLYCFFALCERKEAMQKEDEVPLE
jgi:hypothetical protein